MHWVFSDFRLLRVPTPVNSLHISRWIDAARGTLCFHHLLSAICYLLLDELQASPSR
jgi:hypothetical protein